MHPHHMVDFLKFEINVFVVVHFQHAIVIYITHFLVL